MMTRERSLEVCRVEELPPGSRRVVQTATGRRIVVYNVGGELYALGSVCPHQAGPVGVEDGLVTGTTRTKIACDGRYEPEWIRDGEIVRCGWHLFEFEIQTGRALTDPEMKLPTYAVRIVTDETPRDGNAGQARIVVEV
jgi:nitrite reductase/ring-hydroxylating ferredoxin subunit